MLNKLREAEEKYLHLEASLSDPAVMGDPNKYVQIMKDYKSLTPIIEAYRSYKRAEQNLRDALQLLEEAEDVELRELANEELKLAKEESERLMGELTILLLPRDPNDEKNVIVEIRAGAGGEEAALFAAVLYRMYTMYATAQGFRCSIMNQNPTELGGYRQIAFQIEGDGAYSRFKFESGVHRVQRVPETESQGRIQTSTATVAVLPE
ncbi:MAG: PCRF domain-containing protein, partial [Clostridia bacterium]|nr:PCRF domain-containing protein [Clostridia bacterium]